MDTGVAVVCAGRVFTTEEDSVPFSGAMAKVVTALNRAATAKQATNAHKSLVFIERLFFLDSDTKFATKKLFEVKMTLEGD